MQLRKLIRFTDKYDFTEKNLILRDHLALQRTKLANERTLLSYVKFSIYLIIAGIAFLQANTVFNFKYIGEIALGISILSLTIGIIRYIQLRKEIDKIYNISAHKEQEKPVLEK